jgi:glycerophosphoryl diester phosphodiesterase
MGAWKTLTGQPPVVIAHRGASGDRPEHTLAAYELAIALGADYIEPDLVSTRDGVLVARHEANLCDTTDIYEHPEFSDRYVTKCIDGRPQTGWFTEDFTLAELKTLRVRERLPFRSTQYNDRFEIPTWDDILTLVRQAEATTGRTIGIYPETKHPSYFQSLGLPLEPPLLDGLTRYGYSRAEDAICIQSFETQNLQSLRSQTPLPLIQLIGDAQEVQIDSQRPYADLLTPAGLEAIAQYAQGIGPDKRWIVPAHPTDPTQLLPPTDLVAQAHGVGLWVHPYTFRHEAAFLHPAYGTPAAEYRQFFQLGVDGVFSDFPGAAIAVRDRLDDIL